MPLDRAHMTAAEQITLRMYPLAYASLGLIFLLQEPARTSSPAFVAAKMVLPIRGWGIVFLAVAVLEVAALLIHNRRWYARALTIGVGLAAFWLVLAIASASSSLLASFSGSVWIAIGLGAQAASARMLFHRDVPGSV